MTLQSYTFRSIWFNSENVDVSVFGLGKQIPNQYIFNNRMSLKMSAPHCVDSKIHRLGMKLNPTLTFVVHKILEHKNNKYYDTTLLKTGLGSSSFKRKHTTIKT